MMNQQILEVLAEIYKKFGATVSFEYLSTQFHGISEQKLTSILIMLSEARLIDGVLSCDTLSCIDPKIIAPNISITLHGIEYLECKLPRRLRKHLGIEGI